MVTFSNFFAPRTDIDLSAKVLHDVFGTCNFLSGPDKSEDVFLAQLFETNHKDT